MSKKLVIESCGKCPFYYFRHGLNENQCKQLPEWVLGRHVAHGVLMKRVTYTQNKETPDQCPLPDNN